MNLLSRNRVKLSLLSSVAIALSLVNVSAFSDQERFIDVARVTKVTPISTTVTRDVPERECWGEQVREERPQRRHHSATSTIVGGIIGGAIGNAVGAGSENKKVGAVVGSLLGASVGNDIGRPHRRHHDRVSDVRYRDVERCEVRQRVESERQLVGYNVDYRYRGQHYSTRMDRDPGKQLRVAVNVSPVGN